MIHVRPKGPTPEVVDQLGGSTVWQEIFASDVDALEEVKRTITEDGIASFLRDTTEKLH